MWTLATPGAGAGVPLAATAAYAPAGAGEEGFHTDAFIGREVDLVLGYRDDHNDKLWLSGVRVLPVSAD